MSPLSIRARLTLYYALALALTTLVLSTGVYFLVRADLLRQMDSQLTQDMETVSKVARAEPDDALEVAQQGSATLFEIRSGGRVIVETPAWRRAELANAPLKDSGGMLQTTRNQLYYLKRGVVQTSGAPSGAIDARDGEPGSRRAELGNNTDGKPAAIPDKMRRRHHDSVRGIVQNSSGPLEILVARDGESVRHTLRSLAAVLLVGFACAMGLALVGGHFMAGRVLAPIGAMASKAQAITADKLSERLPVHNTDDELGRLAMTFNSTLARLQDSFDRLRRFTSDASHELRTPLTAMKSVGEVALRDGSDPTAYREGIGSMLEEVDRLTRLVESLLTLTRADSGTATVSRTPTDLSALSVEVMECVRVLADEKHIALCANVTREIPAQVDPTLLRQALINVLDNAIKYTPEGGEVRLAVMQADGQATIEVSDSGPGIPAEHRSLVFDRFYRGDAARSSDTGGVGLGLAIAKWAVEANGGTIELTTEDGNGSVFRITLPTGKEVTQS